VLPQLQQLQRPFDKLRQLVRKLCHSAQAGVLVPTGPALETLAQRVHRAHVAMHGYDLTPLERQLGEALQTHSLLVWDTLHAFGQNHFGRLIHFPPSASPQQSPRTVGGVGGAVDSPQQAQPLPPSHAARLAAQLALSQGGSPASSSSPAGIGSPAASNLGSPSQQDTPPQKTAAPGSVAPPNAAPYAFDPVHHDWRQIESMVRHSIACSEALPAPTDREFEGPEETDGGDGGVGGSLNKEELKHPRSDVAVAVMHHVLRCAQAIQTGMELGVGPCLAQLLPALKEFRNELDSFAQKFSSFEEAKEGEEQEGGDATEGDIKNQQKGSKSPSVDEQLLAKVLFVLPTSPLLQWLSMNGGRKELATMMGSRMGSLLDVLEEVLRHNEAEGLFRSYMSGGIGSGDGDGESSPAAAAVVAVVVGNEASGNAVKLAIESAPELNGTTVSRWKGITITSSAQQQEKEEAEENKEQEANAKKNEKIKSSLSLVGEEHHLAISLLTADEATSAQGRKFISECNEAVWFSASDVLHAAGFDFESSALGVFCSTSAVGSVTSDVLLPGPECHVLATGAQTAAWLEVCRADQLLLAAMQLVQAGDASFEGYLGQMMTNPSHRGTWENMSVPPPAAVLHTLCLGLCGTPPHFSINKQHKSSSGDEGKKVVLHRAVAVLPEELLAPGNYALPVAFGSEEISFQGPAEESESEARDAAAEVALSALVECGLVAAYWQTRALLVQSQQLAAAAVADLSEKMQQHSLVVTGPSPGIMPPSPFVDAAARSTSPTRRPGGAFPGGHSGNDGIINNAPVPTDRLICPICGIVTTSEGHLKEHLAGRRHLKNLERLQQQQQGATTGPARFAAAPGSAGSLGTDEEKAELKRTNEAAGRAGGAEPLTPPRRTKSGIGGSSSNVSNAEGTPPPPQLTTLSTIDRLPSSLSDAFLRRSSSLHRHSSGNVYEGFPCVRVGDVILPSSMDLRAFLDEMQQAGELELPIAGSGNILAGGAAGGVLESLPSIDETTSRGGGSAKHVTTTPIATAGVTTASTAKGASTSSINISIVPPLSFRSGAGGGAGGGSIASGDSGSYQSRDRSGRPPPVPRPGSVYRTNSGNLVYNQYSGGGGGGGDGHRQQQQQQHRGWNTPVHGVGHISSTQQQQQQQQQQRQRYPSRFAQDAVRSGGSGSTGGIYGVPHAAAAATTGAGGFPAGVVAYQATPMAFHSHPHTGLHPHQHHPQQHHIMQQPIAFIPASMSLPGYHPTAITSPTGMPGVGMMTIPTESGAGGGGGTTYVAMPAGSPGAAMMQQGPAAVGPLPAGAYYQQQPQQHQYAPHQYPHSYQLQQQHAQYYGMRSPSRAHSPHQQQQQQPQQRGGGGASWRQQQQQQQQQY
jgi:Zinc-finger of C2H2 type